MMTPSMLASVGVLVMSESDVGWKLMLVQWLEHRNEADRDLVTSFCDAYIERIVDYITACTQPAMLAGKPSDSGYPRYTRCINHSIINMVHTFIVLLEVSEKKGLSEFQLFISIIYGVRFLFQS